METDAPTMDSDGPLSQDCISASQALTANTACQTAFGSIATSGSDSPACSETCKNLIEDVLESCADQVQYI